MLPALDLWFPRGLLRALSQRNHGVLESEMKNTADESVLLVLDLWGSQCVRELIFHANWERVQGLWYAQCSHRHFSARCEFNFKIQQKRIPGKDKDKKIKITKHRVILILQNLSETIKINYDLEDKSYHFFFVKQLLVYNFF